MKSLIIAKKEILDLTRDRRTLMFMFGFPLLFMPLFFIAFILSFFVSYSSFFKNAICTNRF